MRKLRFIAAAAASTLLSYSAMAGFIASTGNDTFTYTGAGAANAPSVGSVTNVPYQPLQSYTPDTPADPQIAPGDLSNFLFTLNLTASQVNGGTVSETGTYDLSYDLGSNGTPDLRVSSGTATLFLTPIGGGQYTATGALTQVLGPQDPVHFRDLAYGNNSNIVLQGGLYTGGTSGGTLALTLRQNALAPEPTSLGLLGVAGAFALRRRRA